MHNTSTIISIYHPLTIVRDITLKFMVHVTYIYNVTALTGVHVGVRALLVKLNMVVGKLFLIKPAKSGRLSSVSTLYFSGCKLFGIY